MKTQFLCSGLKVKCEDDFTLFSQLTQPAFTCSKLTIKTLQKMRNMFKVNNKDTRTTPFWCLIVNFGHISHLALVFLMLTLNM